MALTGCLMKSALTPRSQSLVLRRNNWTKNLAKREAKKAVVIEYVGENAKRTPIIYAWGSAASGALGKFCC